MKPIQFFFIVVDQYPEYRRGNREVHQDIIRNLEIPETNNRPAGTIFVKFIVDKKVKPLIQKNYADLQPNTIRPLLMLLVP